VRFIFAYTSAFLLISIFISSLHCRTLTRSGAQVADLTVLLYFARTSRTCSYSYSDLAVYTSPSAVDNQAEKLHLTDIHTSTGLIVTFFYPTASAYFTNTATPYIPHTPPPCPNRSRKTFPKLFPYFSRLFLEGIFIRLSSHSGRFFTCPQMRFGIPP